MAQVAVPSAPITTDSGLKHGQQGHSRSFQAGFLPSPFPLHHFCLTYQPKQLLPLLFFQTTSVVSYFTGAKTQNPCHGLFDHPTPPHPTRSSLTPTLTLFPSLSLLHPQWLSCCSSNKPRSHPRPLTPALLSAQNAVL